MCIFNRDQNLFLRSELLQFLSCEFRVTFSDFMGEAILYIFLRHVWF